MKLKALRKLGSFKGLLVLLNIAVSKFTSLFIDRDLLMHQYNQLLRYMPQGWIIVNGEIVNTDKKIKIFYRQVKSSDLLVFEQVIINKEYEFTLGELKEIDVPTILDIGANVGYTSTYIMMHLPKAKIIAVEAEKSNFEMLKKNTLQFGSQVKPLHNAIWHTDGEMLEISNDFRDGLDWSKAVKENKSTTDNANKVESQTLATLIKKEQLTSVDLLKMDIEGAEFEVFLKDNLLIDVLGLTKMVAIEIHQESGDPQLIFDILKNAGFEISHIGQTYFGVKK